MKYILLFLATTLAYAGEVDVMEMPTKTGMMSLYKWPCPHLPNKYNYEYAAEATDGADKHLGCWGVDGSTVHIWFYNEPMQPFIASFGMHYFKPKADM